MTGIHRGQPGYTRCMVSPLKSQSWVLNFQTEFSFLRVMLNIISVCRELEYKVEKLDSLLGRIKQIGAGGGSQHGEWWGGGINTFLIVASVFTLNQWCQLWLSPWEAFKNNPGRDSPQTK